MPRYDYTCRRCGRQTERLVKVADRDNQTCTHATVDGDQLGDKPCGGLLDRDEISVTAQMGHNWGNWK